jgi:2,4-dienoyl-CoA reductase-like NADH-dependent reductase (Old Yellow Enzyme family)
MNTSSEKMPAKCHDAIDIGTVHIENRIARSSLAGITDGEYGEVLEPRIGFEETFAKGGVGLIISSHVPIRADGRVLPNYAMIDHDDRIPEWARLVNAVHAYGTKYFLQLSHSGRQQDLGGIQNIYYGQGNLDMRPPSPGSIADPFHGLSGKMLDVAGMQQMVQDFIAAARRAAAAGVDGLELHSSNGYFFTQVISSSSNDRAKYDPNDPYGGELKNRFRFWDEVIRGIKNDPETRHLPLIVKLSVIEDASALRFWRPKGNTLAESIQVAQWAEEAGADAIHVSAGDIFPHPRNPAGYLNTRILRETYARLRTRGKFSRMNFWLFNNLPFIPRLAWERRLRHQLYGSIWRYLFGKRPDCDSPDAAWRKLQGMLAEASRQIKINLKHAKVLCTGAWQSLGPIQAGLERGDFDMVTSARTWMANPEMPGQLVAASKAGEQNLEPERPCTMCNNCLMAAAVHRASCQDETRFLPGTREEQRQIISHGTAIQREEMWRTAKNRMLADDKLLYTRKPADKECEGSANQ